MKKIIFLITISQLAFSSLTTFAESKQYKNIHPICPPKRSRPGWGEGPAYKLNKNLASFGCVATVCLDGGGYNEEFDRLKNCGEPACLKEDNIHKNTYNLYSIKFDNKGRDYCNNDNTNLWKIADKEKALGTWHGDLSNLYTKIAIRNIINIYNYDFNSATTQRSNICTSFMVNYRDKYVDNIIYLAKTKVEKTRYCAATTCLAQIIKWCETNSEQDKNCIIAQCGKPGAAEQAIKQVNENMQNILVPKTPTTEPAPIPTPDPDPTPEPEFQQPPPPAAPAPAPTPPPPFDPTEY